LYLAAFSTDYIDQLCLLYPVDVLLMSSIYILGLNQRSPRSIREDIKRRELLYCCSKGVTRKLGYEMWNKLAKPIIKQSNENTRVMRLVQFV